MSKYVECVEIGKNYPVKLDLTQSFRSIISKDRYDHQSYQALKKISFELDEGDRLGIIGTNGAGKSTLLKILGGIIKPTSGYVKVKGSSTAILEPNNLLYKELTGIENIRIVGRLLGISSGVIKDKTDEIIQFSEIGPFVNQPVRYYSSGMMLRLTMGIYKFLQPDVLLMDEVLSVGDVSFRKKIFDTFKEDFSNIPVMILVSHEMSDVVSFCNKCIYLRDGELVHFGDTGSVYESYSLEHFGKKVEQSFEGIVKVTVKDEAQTLVKKYSDEIPLTFELEIIQEIKEFKLVFYLSNADGSVLTDSLVFRKGDIKSLEEGKYIFSITIPSYLLNMGEYFTHCIIETENIQLVSDFALNKVNVIPDDWELDKPWNIQPKYPLRPRLKWEINKDQL